MRPRGFLALGDRPVFSSPGMPISFRTAHEVEHMPPLRALRKSLVHAESAGATDELCLSINQLVAEGDAETGGVAWRADERERLAPLLVKAKQVLATRESALAKARHEAKMKPFRLARQVGPKGLSVPVPTWDRSSSSSLHPPVTPADKPQGPKARAPVSGPSSRAPMSRSRSGPTLKIQRPSRAAICVRRCLRAGIAVHFANW